MSFRKSFIAAAITVVASLSGAQAATLDGNFTVEVVNFSTPNNSSSSVSKATTSNFETRFNAGVDGVTTDVFHYSGFLDFRVGGPQKAAYSILTWLNTGTGTVSNLDADVSALQLSFPKFQTTTLFRFTTTYDADFNFSVTHDDGVTFFDDGAAILTSSNPTAVKTTGPGAFDGGAFSFIYAAANGNPSVLEVTGDNLPPAVPLPASALLLLGGIGLMGAMGRKKAAHASLNSKTR